MKIEEMADVFLNSANFASHAFLTLAPPSGYALSLKALIMMSKVSWTSQLSYEILRSSLERKFDKTNFISPKSTPPKRQKYIGRYLLFFLTRWYVSKLHIRFKTKAWILNLDQRYVSIPQHFFCKNFQNGGYNFVGESRACQDFDAKGFISIVEKFVVYVADFFDTLSVMKGW